MTEGNKELVDRQNQLQSHKQSKEVVIIVPINDIVECCF